jgi:hypothetical protein
MPFFLDFVILLAYPPIQSTVRQMQCSVVIEMNRQGRQSSILIDITLDLYRFMSVVYLFIQIISYFVSTINASLLDINT